jgi:hypothetical protein
MKSQHKQIDTPEDSLEAAWRYNRVINVEALD